MIACTKYRAQLTAQIDSAKRTIDEELRAKGLLAQNLKNSTSDIERMKAQLDEEILIKIELQKTISKLSNELQTWRSKY